jgi:hypothetical protein
LISPIRLDISPLGEDLLLTQGSIQIKRGSLHLYGEDIREPLLPEPLPIYLRQTTFGAVHPLFRARHQPEVLTFPLDYPDPDGMFYGYDYRTYDHIAEGEHRGIKGLVTGATWAATALIALRTGRYVSGKRDCVQTYTTEVADEWAPFLEAVHRQCRGAWNYRIPQTSDERAELQQLCARMLAFENHFLAVLRGYLLTALRAADLNQLFAAQQLSTILYDDADTIEVLTEVERTGEGEVQAHASLALKRITNTRFRSV